MTESSLPSAVIFTHASPFAPKLLAVSPNASIRVRVIADPPCTMSALTIPPFATASRKTLKSVCVANPLRSWSSISNRRSGLSDLRFEMLLHDLSRSEEHTSELQSLAYLVCRLLLEKKKTPPTATAHLNPLEAGTLRSPWPS